MTTLAKEILDEVKERAGALGDIPGVKMVAISLGYTMVELDNGTLGLCYTPRAESRSCSHNAKAGALAGTPALELSDLMLSRIPLEKSVGVAAVTALSQVIMDQAPDAYHYADADFLTLLPLDGTPKRVGMVGHIGPFIPFLAEKAASLTILDDNPVLVPGFQNREYTVTRDINDLYDAEILIITGSSAAVADFDAALAAAPSAAFTAVVGPSAGWLPDPAFRRGVHAVAGTRIVDAAAARRVILEGGGTRQFSPYGQKYTVLNPQEIQPRRPADQ